MSLFLFEFFLDFVEKILFFLCGVCKKKTVVELCEKRSKA